MCHPWVQEGHWTPEGRNGGHSEAGPHHDNVLTTALRRAVAPQANLGEWVLSPGQILGAEGWVELRGRRFGGPATRSGGSRWLWAKVLFVVLVVLPMETGLVQAPSSLPVLPGTLRVLRTPPCHHGQALVVPTTTSPLL